MALSMLHGRSCVEGALRPYRALPLLAVAPVVHKVREDLGDSASDKLIQIGCPLIGVAESLSTLMSTKRRLLRLLYYLGSCPVKQLIPLWLLRVSFSLDLLRPLPVVNT